MKVVSPYHGALVAAEGTVVRTVEGLALVPDVHRGAVDDMTACFSSDVPFLVHLEGEPDVRIGEHVKVAGTWTGHRIRPRRVDTTELAMGAKYGSAGPAVRPPGRIRSGPPTDVELPLIEDGTIAGRLPYADGTVHVVTDDPALVTTLLRPVYGNLLRVVPATYSRAERRSAQAAVDVAGSLGVLCAVGMTTPQGAEPAELIYTLEVAWVPHALAVAVDDLPEGLLTLDSHVAVTN